MSLMQRSHASIGSFSGRPTGRSHVLFITMSTRRYCSSVDGAQRVQSASLVTSHAHRALDSRGRALRARPTRRGPRLCRRPPADGARAPNVERGRPSDTAAAACDDGHPPAYLLHRRLPRVQCSASTRSATREARRWTSAAQGCGAARSCTAIGPSTWDAAAELKASATRRSGSRGEPAATSSGTAGPARGDRAHPRRHRLNLWMHDPPDVATGHAALTAATPTASSWASA